MVAINFTDMDLGSLGTSIGSMLTNLAEPLFTFLIYMAIVAGVVGIFGAVVLVIVRVIKGR